LTKKKGETMSGRRGLVKYSEAFKQKVVKEIEHGKYSIAEARQIYDIGGTSTIHGWIKRSGKNHILGKVVRIETADEKKKIKELEKEIKQLKEALTTQTIKSLGYEKMIELAEQRHKIEIKKKNE